MIAFVTTVERPMMIDTPELVAHIWWARIEWDLLRLQFTRTWHGTNELNIIKIKQEDLDIKCIVFLIIT